MKDISDGVLAVLGGSLLKHNILVGMLAAYFIYGDHNRSLYFQGLLSKLHSYKKKWEADDN